METGYKVLDVRKDGLYSLVIRRAGGMRYLPGQCNIPMPGWGPMCVLPDVALAVGFLKMYGDMAMGKAEIYQVGYERSQETMAWEPFIVGIDATRIGMLSEGTILADRVWLERVVKV